MKIFSRKNPFRIFYLTRRAQIKSATKIISLIISLIFVAVPLVHAFDNALANRAIDRAAESLENLQKMWHAEADLQKTSTQNQKNLHAAAESEREFLQELCRNIEFQNSHCWEIKKNSQFGN